MVLFFAQLRVATADKIEIPESLLRRAEQRLEKQGLRLTFGAIHCDSSGHVVVRGLRLFSDTHSDPVLTVEAVRFQINPLALLLYDVAPRMVARIDGASLRMPAMLSSDGTNIAVIDGINAEIEFKSDTTLAITGLTASFGNLTFLCRGSMSLPAPDRDREPDPREGAEKLADAIAKYLRAKPAFDQLTQRLALFENPVLDITFTPDRELVASARVEFFANGLKTPDWKNAGALSPATGGSCGPLLLTTTIALGDLRSRWDGSGAARQPPPLSARFSIAEALFSPGVRVRNVRVTLDRPFDDALRIRDEGPPSSFADMPDIALSLQCSADSVTTREFTARTIIACADGRFPRELRARVAARMLGEPVTLEGDANLVEETATARIATRIATEHIAALSQKLDYDIGAILKPARPIDVSATARFAAGWRFTDADGALDIGPIVADDVAVDRAHGRFAYDHAGGGIIFTPAKAVIGESFARGSYEMNFNTLDYRFLLAGRLRPPAIDGWLGKWWPRFWSTFTFSGEPPFGDVEVSGNWRDGNLVRVFVFADATALTYRGVAFDHVLLTQFSRPDYHDVQDLFARRGGGYARGSFTHQDVEPGDRHLLTVLDFKAENMDPIAVVPAISAEVAEALAPLKFEKPLTRVRVAGRIDGPASPRGRRVLLDADAEGAGPLTYAGIPFTNLSTSIRMRDDVMDITRLESQFAGGHFALKAQLSGPGESRRIGFDLNVSKAGFGEAARLIEELSARRRGVTLPPEDATKKQPAHAQLDLRLSADGLLRDDLSFHGNGSAEVSGAELVNVNIFGALSEALRGVRMLNFTSLNLTDGQFNFTIDGRSVFIPEAVLTGQKAHVKISGEYTLDTRFANLTAKVYPLSESRGLLGKGLGFLLVPITHLAELKLTGSLDAPKWRFSYGPTSLFRALAGKSSDTEALEKERGTSGEAEQSSETHTEDPPGGEAQPQPAE